MTLFGVEEGIAKIISYKASKYSHDTGMNDANNAYSKSRKLNKMDLLDEFIGNYSSKTSDLSRMAQYVRIASEQFESRLLFHFESSWRKWHFNKENKEYFI